MIDLVCLVADQNMKAVTESLLDRHQALGIRSLTWRVITHPGHDPGCYQAPRGLLQPFVDSAHHALVMLDRAWDGVPGKPTTELEDDVDRALTSLREGWAKCIVIDPELEIWLFTRAPTLEQALGWQGRTPDLQTMLDEKGLWRASAEEPTDPKTAIKIALSQVGGQTSSSIYRQIAEKIGLKRCSDPSFHRLRTQLQQWFPATP